MKMSVDGATIEDIFFSEFATFATAPGGVQKLRELILQLAVQGQLVPQDPTDEPANALLERIAAEKKRLVREGVIRKVKSLPLVREEEVPFEIPDSWRWTWIANVTYNFGQKVPEVDFTYIDVSSIDKDKGVVSSEVNILRPEEAPSRARKIVSKDTVIYSTVRPYLLNIAIIEQNYNPKPIVSTAFAILHPHIGLANRFLYYYLRSPQFTEFVEHEMSGMAYPAINEAKFFKGLIPLPPISEQHRIVAKVDALMQLCDTFEVQQAQQQETHTNLGTAALASVAEAEDSAAFDTAWSWICDEFDLIFDKPDNVVALRQVVLQLAVRGKLVSQDLADEPASVLFEKIKAERAQITKENTKLPPIERNEIKFILPSGWLWSRIGNLFYTSSGTTPLRSIHKYFVDGTEYWVKTTDLNNDIVTSCEEKITKDAVNQCNLKYYPIGTVCVAMYGGAGTIGKSGILGIKSTINQSVCAIYPSEYVDSKYLHNYIKSIRPDWMRFAAGLRKAPNINGKIIKGMVIPLPPLAEQHRIVEKVDALMSLCDDLEAQIRKRQEVQAKLLEAVVAEMVAQG